MLEAVFIRGVCRGRTHVDRTFSSVEGDWQRTRGFDRLLLFGPIFYAAPVAAFGTEHFTLTKSIASIIPAWARNPGNRFGVTLALRELAFSGGPLALAAALSEEWNAHVARILATIARYFIAIPVLFFSVEQFLHGDHVPGIPLKPTTPPWLWGHAIWTYVAAVAYAVTGTMLLLGKRTRAAATGLGVAVLFVELVIYVPIDVVERASLANGLNYLADTLMFGGAALMLASAMPREEWRHERWPFEGPVNLVRPRRHEGLGRADGRGTLDSPRAGGRRPGAMHQRSSRPSSSSSPPT